MFKVNQDTGFMSSASIVNFKHYLHFIRINYGTTDIIAEFKQIMFLAWETSFRQKICFQ